MIREWRMQMKDLINIKKTLRSCAPKWLNLEIDIKNLDNRSQEEWNSCFNENYIN